MLAYPKECVRLILTTDASDTAMGAALEQANDGKREPLGFFSQKFTPTQTKYSAYDRDLLAVYSAIKYFCFMIERKNPVIYTDHKPLIYVFNQRPTKVSPRQQHQLEFISQFTTDIRHIAGEDNKVADALSRVNDVTLPVIITTEDIATAQLTDDELKELIRNPTTSLTLKQLRLDGTEIAVYYDISTNRIRLYHIFRHRCEKRYSTLHIIPLIVMLSIRENKLRTILYGRPLTKISQVGYAHV